MKNNLPIVMLGVLVGSIVGFIGSQTMKDKEDDLIYSINDKYEKVLVLVVIVAVLLVVLGVMIYGK